MPKTYSVVLDVQMVKKVPFFVNVAGNYITWKYIIKYYYIHKLNLL